MAMKAKLKRKSFFVDELALQRAKRALGAKTDAEVIRLSVERIAEMEGEARGPYGGALLRHGADGILDTTFGSSAAASKGTSPAARLTDAAVAARLGRHWLGCDLSGDYARKAQERAMHARETGQKKTTTYADKGIQICRPKKKLVDMMSNFSPCLRQSFRASGRLGCCMKP
jgi:hypothetical protein